MADSQLWWSLAELRLQHPCQIYTVCLRLYVCVCVFRWHFVRHKKTVVHTWNKEGRFFRRLRPQVVAVARQHYWSMHVLCPLHASAERHFGPSLVSFFYGGVLNLDIEMRVMHSQRGKPMWLGGGGVEERGGGTFCWHSSVSKAVIDHPTVAENMGGRMSRTTWLE